MTRSVFRIITSLLFFLTAAVSCSEDEYPGIDQFVIAFKNPSENFLSEEYQKEIELSFSHPAPEDGYVDIRFLSELEYGENGDFITTPIAENGSIRIPIVQGSRRAILNVEKTHVIPAGALNTIIFEIHSVFMPSKAAFSQGNTQTTVFLSERASLGGTANPTVGGPNQPNQVYFNLRKKTETVVRRDAWDLAFYSGENFHVRLNGSLYMMAAPINSTNIDAVREADVAAIKPHMGFLIEGSDQYVDHPNGDPNQYAIAAISENDAENPVYLLKMGNAIGTETPEPGGVAVAGADRGWKKIRILRRSDSYILQYAEIDSNTHQEIQIPKSPAYDFTFFSLETANTLLVTPERSHWDLNFSVATEIEAFPDGSLTAYGYSDYVQTNTLAGVQVYKVTTDIISYEDFSTSDIDPLQFSINPRTIGSSWRNTFPSEKRVYSHIFYIIRDFEDNTYKLRFTALEDENGIRGNPQFEYKLLD